MPAMYYYVIRHSFINQPYTYYSWGAGLADPYFGPMGSAKPYADRESAQNTIEHLKRHAWFTGNLELEERFI